MGLTYSVLCDLTIDQPGAAITETVTIEDVCRPHVTVRHAAGCSEREVVIEENISQLVIVDEDEVG